MIAEDNRKFKRLALDKPVKLYPVFPGDVAKNSDPALDFLSGRLTDLGAGGAGLVADVPLRMGSILKLHFELKKERWIEIFGKIAWSRGLAAGIQFFSLTEIPLRTIQRHISELLH